LALLVGGCNWPWSSGEPWHEEPAPQTGASGEAPVDTYADFRLERLIEDEARLLAEFRRRGGEIAQLEKERRLRALGERYRLFVEDNPDHLYGRIIFGKFLRLVDDRERAHEQFRAADRLDPEVAVVKQQLGNYYFEKGEVTEALPYFLAARELDPEVAVYQYQVGEALAQGREALVEAGTYTRETVDRRMLAAFARAAELAPSVRDFQMRHAEAYFDVATPDWERALALWEGLAKGSDDEAEQAVIALQKARVLLELGRAEEARALARSVSQPALEQSRQRILDMAGG
jgi:tetratricopeptide (TPR) repeat protein